MISEWFPNHSAVLGKTWFCVPKTRNFRFCSFSCDLGWFCSFSHDFVRFRRFSSIFIDFHRFSSIFIDLRRFSSVFVGLRRFSSIFIDFRRFSSIFSILLDFHHFAPFSPFCSIFIILLHFRHFARFSPNRGAHIFAAILCYFVPFFSFPNLRKVENFRSQIVPKSKIFVYENEIFSKFSFPKTKFLRKFRYHYLLFTVLWIADSGNENLPSGIRKWDESGTKKSGNFRFCFGKKSKIFVPVLAKNAKFSCPNRPQTHRKRLQNGTKKTKKHVRGIRTARYRRSPDPKTDALTTTPNRHVLGYVAKNAKTRPKSQNPIQNRRNRFRIAKPHPESPKSLQNRQNPSENAKIAPKSRQKPTAKKYDNSCEKTWIFLPNYQAFAKKRFVCGCQLFAICDVFGCGNCRVCALSCCFCCVCCLCVLLCLLSSCCVSSVFCPTTTTTWERVSQRQRTPKIV